MASAQQPQQFGKYTLIERIAVGGMAEVYRAKTYGAAGFEKQLVIKRILEKFSGDEEFVRMFIDEARLAALLQHPNLVQIFDFDRVESPAGSSYYIAMEWVDGKDLRQIMREMGKQKRSLSFAGSVHIAIETLRGLHYAHTKAEGGVPLDIVHRDVSPHNILVSYGGDVKLSDFGIAKAAARASATSNGMVKGKLAYMSPEQITGQKLDRRSDVFSLGIVLFEMLTRSRLFSGESEIEVIDKVRDGKVPPPRSRNPDLPVDLEQVLLKMLARDANNRYQSAAEAAKALAGTSVHSATEAMSLGEFVAGLFPPVQQPAIPPVAAPAQPDRKSEPMSNQSSNPPSGKPPAAPELSGAATMMMEAPKLPPPAAAATPIADQKTAILEAGSPEMANVQAQIAEARAKAAAASAAPAPAPIADQKTAILDTNSPQMAGVQAQIAAARGGGAPAAPAPQPITDQKTAILDANSPQMVAVQAQISAARNQAGGGSQAPMTDQKTAILDTNSPQMAGVQAQIAAAAQRNAPAPQGGGQRTMALDVSAQQAQMRRQGPPSQSLSQLTPPRKPPGAWTRWVLGPAITIASAGLTYGAAGVVVPERPHFTPPPPPPPIAIGKIHLETNPPGAGVTLDGKPHPHFTPTDIEGPVGETVTHVIVKLAGYKPQEQDVLFTNIPQRLSLNLEATADILPAKHPSGHHGSSPAAPTPATPTAAPAKGGDTAMAPVADKGTLAIYVDGGAAVTVDGQSVGQTPIGGLTLKAGKHTIELTNDALGKREKVVVEVKERQSSTLKRHWK